MGLHAHLGREPASLLALLPQHLQLVQLVEPAEAARSDRAGLCPPGLGQLLCGGQGWAGDPSRLEELDARLQLVAGPRVDPLH